MDVVFLHLVDDDDVDGLGWSDVFMVHFLIRTVNHINGYCKEMHQEGIGGVGHLTRKGTGCWGLGRHKEVIFVGFVGFEENIC